MLCTTYSDVMEDERSPASIVLMCMRQLCIEGNDKQMRRVRVLCENSSGTESLVKGMTDGISG